MTEIEVKHSPIMNEIGLFKEFQFERFNALKDITESQKISLDDTATMILKDLVANDLHDYLGICRIHNHFKLNRNEILQLSLGLSVNDTTFKTDHDALVAYLKPLVASEQIEPPVPYMWAYDKTGEQFFPVQYFDGSNNSMKHRLQQVCKQPDTLIYFLQQLVSHLEATGTENDLGFYLRYEHLIKLDNKNGDILMENTDIAARKQYLVPKTEKMLNEILMEERQHRPNFSFTKTHWYHIGLYDDQGNDVCCATSCGHGPPD